MLSLSKEFFQSICWRNQELFHSLSKFWYFKALQFPKNVATLLQYVALIEKERTSALII